MVLALLRGDKTQERRLIVPQPCEVPYQNVFGEADSAVFWRHGEKKEDWPTPERCPYGKPGDRLWVKETWRTWEQEDLVDGVFYRADGAFRPIESTPKAAEAWMQAHANGRHYRRWRPSSVMPRFAARIFLDLVDVRVARLLDMNEADARAEGVAPQGDGPAPHLAAYRLFWEEHHKDHTAWPMNPYVWVLTYRRIEVPGGR